MRSTQRNFTSARRAEGAVRTWSLHINDLHIVRNLLDIRETGTLQGRVLFDVLIVLCQRQANTLCQTTVDLAVNDQKIVDLTNIGDHGHLLHGGLSGCNLHSYLSHEQAVHIATERVTLAVLVAITCWRSKLTVVTQIKAFSL